MSKEALLETLKRDPARYFRNPANVVRDRRLTNRERAEILRAWAQSLEATADMGADAASLLSQLQEAQATIEKTPERRSG
ncbi:MAG: hypothetical protein J0I26_05445 [Alphaproteobacteria bacterium]|jgi:hypothetical protein|nr:hypothetical protein [Alphaproteobacteria bacterium]OJU58196.1 MAG: hypothetical protein BGO00_13495 [Alphaproteobacteria bacterium 62-8]MBN9556958.1 hypothetical protein [Alphaproteobacteria bacterium]MBN9567909.1 hypothetical protein [Alphaproteobacteria bacterium]MBN9571687.1 hypothetical protein [Alphaproteobacteria bacterium]